MVKYLKISQTNCNPCTRIKLFLDNNAVEKHYAMKDITSLNEIVDDNILYNVEVESNPEIAAHFELSGVPAIIELDENNNVKSTRYGYDSSYLEEVVGNIG